MRVGIFVNDSLPKEARAELSEYDVFEVEAADSVLSECQVLIGWPGRANKVLKKMPNLRILQTFTAGVDSLDFEALPPGVVVFSNAGAYSKTVGEHAWGLLLGAAKGLHTHRERSVPRSLRGKTLLVIGCGGIGSEVARLSRSLEMRTVGVSRSFKSPEAFDDKRPLAELPEAVGSADAIAISVPLTSQTRGLISYDLLARTKDSVVIVNVGRGETVDEAGLMRWLKERPESRYTTDVFWTRDGRESFDTPAWNFPNFSGTLHISGDPLGDDQVEPKIRAARNVKRFLSTGSAENRVDLGEYFSRKS
jgi:D-3-phosphoglycerate dehydrogenase / 2-oxoglutarate reductase